MSAEQPETDAEPDVEFGAVDVDEIVRQERVRSIFESRRECREQRTTAKKHLSVGDRSNASIMYRGALESYIREVEPLFAQTEQGVRYWKETNFGVLDLRPSFSELPGSHSQRGAVPDWRIENADGRRLELQLAGVGSIFELDTPVESTLRVFVDSPRRGGGTTEKTVTTESHVPFRVLDEMYAVTNSYLREIDFGIEIGETQKNTKLDDDLLDEVADWRDANL